MTEHPGLHGVWYYDKIFIKPIPPYLLCGAFWEYVQEIDEEVFRAAAGFMRTYCHLIQYESDFQRATSPDLQLIPHLDGEALTFEDFVAFLAQFQNFPNSAVSARYSFGFLRLSRLNYLAPIFLGKLMYFHLHPQWKDYLGRFIAPIVTLFAILSTILNCMQVVLAAQSLDTDGWDSSWIQFLNTCRWFPIAVMILIAFLMALLVVLLLIMITKTRLSAHTAMRGRADEVRSVPRKNVSVTMHGNRSLFGSF